MVSGAADAIDATAEASRLGVGILEDDFFFLALRDDCSGTVETKGLHRQRDLSHTVEWHFGMHCEAGIIAALHLHPQTSTVRRHTSIIGIIGTREPEDFTVRLQHTRLF